MTKAAQIRAEMPHTMRVLRRLLFRKGIVIKKAEVAEDMAKADDQTSFRDMAVGAGLGAGAVMAGSAGLDTYRRIAANRPPANWRQKVRDAWREVRDRGETVVFRGAPQADFAPKKRNYHAVYLSPQKHVTGEYAAGGAITRYAMPRGLKLFNTTRRPSDLKGKIAERKLRIATVTHTRDAGNASLLEDAALGLGVPVGARSDSPKRMKLSEIKQAVRAHEAMPASAQRSWRWETQWNPSKPQVQALQRAGYDGMVGQKKAVALFDESKLRPLYAEGAGAQGATTLGRFMGRALRNIRFAKAEGASMTKAAKDETDRRLTQPAQVAGGAMAGSVAAHYGAWLASRYGDRTATLAGRRMGAWLRLQGQRAKADSGMAGRIAYPIGRTADAILRQQSHMVRRIGRAGTKAALVGAGIGVAAAAGDFAGDYVGRKLTGVSGENDHYRHMSLLGAAGGVGGGVLGHTVANSFRRLRNAGSFARVAVPALGGAIGAAAGELAGNTHDHRMGITRLVSELDRRKEMGKADRPLAKFGNPGPWYTPAGTARDPQMGYGTPFARSWLPDRGDYKAGKLFAQDSPTGGSTQAQTFSTGFKNWRSGQNFRQWFGTFIRGGLSRSFGEIAGGAMGGNSGRYGQTPSYGFGTAFGGAPEGDLFRADGGALAKRLLSEAEHQQRVEAAHASVEARRGRYHGTDDGAAPGVRQAAWGQAGDARGRQLPGGPGNRLGSPLRGFITVPRNKDPEFRDVSPVSGRWFKAAPQRPKGMSEEQYHDLARKAGAMTRALRDAILLRGQESGLIPQGADPRHVKLAFTHARNLALHDAGLFRYDFGFAEDDKPALRQMVPFMRYARRRMINDLRAGFKGQWKQFKDEYGHEFADRRTDPRTGEVRRRFYPHMEYVKADGGELGKLYNDLSAAQLQQRRDAARASAEKRRRAGGIINHTLAVKDDAAAWLYDAHVEGRQKHEAASAKNPFDAAAFDQRLGRNLAISTGAGILGAGAAMAGARAYLGRGKVPLKELGEAALQGSLRFGGIGGAIAAPAGAYYATDKKRRDALWDGDLEFIDGIEAVAPNVVVPAALGAATGVVGQAGKIGETARAINAAGHGNGWVKATRMAARTILPSAINGASVGMMVASNGVFLPIEEGRRLYDAIVPSKEAVLGGLGAVAAISAAPAIHRTVTARSRLREYRQALKEMRAKGETLVFRGAPVVDEAPIARGYSATYVARHKPVTYRYAGVDGGIARYALKPGLRFVDLTQKHGTAADKDMAQRLIWRDRAEQIARGEGRGLRDRQLAAGLIKPGYEKLQPFRDQWKRARGIDLQPEYRGGWQSMLADEGHPDMTRLHWAPSEAQVKYMLRRGIAGTTSGRRNLAMNDPGYVRFIAGVPRSTSYAPDRVLRRLAHRGKQAANEAISTVRGKLGLDKADLGKGLFTGSALAAGIGAGFRAGRWALGVAGHALNAGASAGAMTGDSVRRMAMANYRRRLSRSRPAASLMAQRANNAAYARAIAGGARPYDADQAGFDAGIKAFRQGLRRPRKFGALPMGAKLDRIALGGAAAYGAYSMMRPSQPQY